jgi:hypothetical protein
MRPNLSCVKQMNERSIHSCVTKIEGNVLRTEAEEEEEEEAAEV